MSVNSSGASDCTSPDVAVSGSPGSCATLIGIVKSEAGSGCVAWWQCGTTNNGNNWPYEYCVTLTAQPQQPGPPPGTSLKVTPCLVPLQTGGSASGWCAGLINQPPTLRTSGG